MLMEIGQESQLRQVEQFIYREARQQDEHRYAEWESLWTDDGVYWVPANGDDIDPEQQMSIIYDNRSRIGLRVRQLLSGRHYSQEPRSRLRDLRMAKKTVKLVNNDKPLYTLSFLI
jgi:3-phenylpropionate/cinnamic acid dioxygenase small subunit